MRVVYLLLVVLFVSVGCKSSKVDDRPVVTENPPLDSYYIATDDFIGHREIEAPVRKEMRDLLILVGSDPSEADTMKFVGNRIEPLGRNRDGYHGALPISATEGVDVHGANSGTATNRDGSLRLGWSEFWFAFPEDGKPDGWTVRHEAMHQIGNCCCGFSGHPEEFVCNGRHLVVKDVLGHGIRWPAAVWNAVRHPIAVWDGSGYKCLKEGEWE
jgi:hypothetical protein